MAKTKYEIEMDYRKACAAADDLEQVAKEIRRIAVDQLDQLLLSVADAWQGDNASLFIKKGNKIQIQIEDRARTISQIADTLRQMATAMHDAEVTNIEIATQETR